jgi:hypothetical protein
MNISSEFAQKDAVNWKKYDPTTDPSEDICWHRIYPVSKEFQRITANNTWLN